MAIDRFKLMDREIHKANRQIANMQKLIAEFGANGKMQSSGGKIRSEERCGETDQMSLMIIEGYKKMISQLTE